MTTMEYILAWMGQWMPALAAFLLPRAGLLG
jgi:hypothetical protein